MVTASRSCAHTTVVLGVTLDDAARFAAHFEPIQGRLVLVSYRCLDRIRGLVDVKAVHVSMAALEDPAYPAAAHELRHMGFCSCPRPAAASIAPAFAPMDPHGVRPPAPRDAVATLIGLLLILGLIVGLLFGWLPT